MESLALNSDYGAMNLGDKIYGLLGVAARNSRVRPDYRLDVQTGFLCNEVCYQRESGYGHSCCKRDTRDEARLEHVGANPNPENGRKRSKVISTISLNEIASHCGRHISASLF